MKKTIRKILLISFTILVLLLISYNYNDITLKYYKVFYHKEIKVGNEIVSILDGKKLENNIVDFQKIIRSNEKYKEYYFRKLNDMDYEIYTGLSLGTSLVYNSVQKRWYIDYG